MGARRYEERFIAWLTDEGAAYHSVAEFLDGFCRFLNREGFAIRRCNLATRTVHPQMVAIRHVWTDHPVEVIPVNPMVVVRRRQYRIGEAMIDEIYFNAMNEENPQYLASPFYRLLSCGELYEPIHPVGEPQSFPVFDDLAKEGCSGYFGLYLKSFAGVRQQIGLVTMLPQGLCEKQIENLRWSLGLFTLHLNTLMEYSIKNTLARTYIGEDPGRRVCDGMIGMGEVVSLEAAIWFSDLRGFTAISDGMDAEQLIDILNAYFEVVVQAIYERGGDVLKYIGDAILAIFPVSSFNGAEGACEAALLAAEDSAARLAVLNESRIEHGQSALEHGVSLHLGNAQYGNIGSRQRLDFTLIGREVNIASRIEGLTKQVGETMLCSAPFVAASKRPMRSVGDFRLKGVAAPMEVFAPR